MTKKPTDPSEAPGFEQAMERLENLVEEMEQGELPLDEAMARFEEGMGLIKHCTGKLNEAEKKIELLIEKNGALETTPLDPGTVSDESA